jgi:hypothetical protein
MSWEETPCCEYAPSRWRSPPCFAFAAPAAAAPPPVAHWTFNEGTGATAADSAGSHPATLLGGAGWTAGIQGPFALDTGG